MMAKTKIRIMIVDDHAVVRSGLGAFLMSVPDMLLVGEAENGEQAVARAAEQAMQRPHRGPHRERGAGHGKTFSLNLASIVLRH